MEPLIKTQNLSFVYNRGKDNEFRALININIEIFPKEFVIIFGPSGCGKSTLLNIIAGLETAEEGSIFVSGKETTHMSKREFTEYHRKGVGMIYQAYNLITSLTVLDNVALPQVFVENNRKIREKKSLELLDRFGIKEHANKIPTELSGGQQQRIGVARSIVNDPYLILADEPIGNLDSVSAKNVLEIMADLNEKEKKTIIMVTHNPEYLNYGDRILHMKDGMITREIINRQKQRKIGGSLKDLAKPPSTELDNLLRAYQELSPEQINILIMPYKAKIFTHHFITSRNLQETKSFEDIMQRKLMNTITQEEFYDILNRADDEGGVGFNKRTAGKIVRRINRAIRMAHFIYKKARQRKDEQGRHQKVTKSEKIDKLTEYLLMTCYSEYYHKLSDEVVQRLKHAVADRLDNTINKSDFYRTLDMSFKGGGVGLNRRTARNISEEMELVLILGFGIAPSLQAPVSAFPSAGGSGMPPSGDARPPQSVIPSVGKAEGAGEKAPAEPEGPIGEESGTGDTGGGGSKIPSVTPEDGVGEEAAAQLEEAIRKESEAEDAREHGLMTPPDNKDGLSEKKPDEKPNEGTDSTNIRPQTQNSEYSDPEPARFEQEIINKFKIPKSHS